MTDQDIFIRIASITSLSEQDLDDLEACNPTQLAAIMRGYENDGKVGGSAVWREVSIILQEAARYAPLASAILNIVTVV
jgi:hypothetical protein